MAEVKHVRFLVPVDISSPWYKQFQLNYEKEKAEGGAGIMVVPTDPCALEEVEIDEFVVRDHVDASLRLIVNEKLKEFGVDRVVQSRLERSVEIAVKQAIDSYTQGGGGVLAKVRSMLEEMVSKRVAADYEVAVDVRIQKKGNGNAS